jgi:hypothetical protein
MNPRKVRFSLKVLMAIVAAAALASALCAHVYRILNPPPAVPDSQMAALYLHDAKQRLSAAEKAKDAERSERLLLGAEYDLIRSQVYALKAQASQEVSQAPQASASP